MIRRTFDKVLSKRKGVVRIKVTGGVVVCDKEDLALVLKHKWCIDSSGYAHTKIKRIKKVYLHRLLTSAQKGQYVDHINRNRKDNRRCNLRLTSAVENGHNRGLSKNNSSGYRGVWLDKRRSFWVAEMWIDRKKYYIGSFPTAQEAGDARNNFAKEIGLLEYGVDSERDEVLTSESVDSKEKAS